MNSYVKALALSALMLANSIGVAYEDLSHNNMSEAAFGTSDIEKLSIYTLFGMNNADKYDLYRDRFLVGAIEEDLIPRPLNHFFNPLTGKGLTFGSLNCPPASDCEPSPDWIINGKGQTPGDKFFSYYKATLLYYKALTLSTGEAREASTKDLFTNLGHVVHHIQDMAQPQHVRNDDHCEDPLCAAIQVFYPSAFERFAEDNAASFITLYPSPSYSIFPAPTQEFSSARQFWKNDSSNSDPQKDGIASITNRSFVSYGTNFSWASTSCSIPAFPLPSLQQSKIVTVNNTSVVEYGSGVYISSLSALSLVSSRKAFTLTSMNYQPQLEKLVPQAISYSAGLINFFFRGEIGGAWSSTNFTLVVTNFGAELDNGAFEKYYDDSSGQRRRVGEWSFPILQLPSGASVTTDLRQPGLSPNGRYILVFKPADMCTSSGECSGDGAGAVGSGSAIEESSSCPPFC